jgi:hypothetical protein
VRGRSSWNKGIIDFHPALDRPSPRFPFLSCPFVKGQLGKFRLRCRLLLLLELLLLLLLLLL